MKVEYLVWTGKEQFKIMYDEQQACSGVHVEMESRLHSCPRLKINNLIYNWRQL